MLFLEACFESQKDARLYLLRFHDMSLISHPSLVGQPSAVLMLASPVQAFAGFHGMTLLRSRSVKLTSKRCIWKSTPYGRSGR